MKSFSPAIIITLLLVSSITHAQETIYVDDVIYVPLRSGQGSEYRIINAAIKSGTQLTLLDEGEDGTWSQVRLPDGQEGWIRSQYLSREKTAQLKLNETQARLARLEQQNETLKDQNAVLINENSALKQSYQESDKTASQIAEELEELKKLSANAITLDENYQALLRKQEVLQTQNDSLRAENENLKNDKSLTFLLYGAGIFILGMIIAVILPVLKPKKTYSEWR